MATEQQALIPPLKLKWVAFGQVPAKSNHYSIRAPKKGMPFTIKTPELKDWEKNFAAQVTANAKNQQISNQVRITLRVWFRSQASDLDNAAKGILDGLQKASVIVNDNRVKELHMFKDVDPSRPRVEITVEELY